MTPTILQDVLVEDIKQELSGFLLKNVKGESVNLNIYPQNLPAKKGQKDSEHFPYILVRIIDGEAQEKDYGEVDDTCKIGFIIGIFDESDNYQGYKDTMNILDKIKQRLFSKKHYNNQFEIVYPYKWLIHDEDTYPYYFGGAETNWKMPTINMDDNLI